jgi:L-ascorbate metabolism protein UlaG (beta-lactamase superfamily)
MVITWFGQSCIKLQNKDTALVFDPYNASIGFPLPKLSASILCITHDHYDHNNVKAVGGDPFVIDQPGEYEVRGTFVYGIPSFHDASQGKERGPNIIYAVEFEDVFVTHLGDLGTTELTDEQMERIEGTDILFIPVGGKYTINAKQAVDVIQRIEPRIIIPIHYKIPKLKEPLDDVSLFLKAQGVKNGEPLESLKISKKDLPQDKTETIVLRPKL